MVYNDLILKFLKHADIQFKSALHASLLNSLSSNIRHQDKNSPGIL